MLCDLNSTDKLNARKTAKILKLLLKVVLTNFVKEDNSFDDLFAVSHSIIIDNITQVLDIDDGDGS